MKYFFDIEVVPTIVAFLSIPEMSDVGDLVQQMHDRMDGNAKLIDYLKEQNAELISELQALRQQREASNDGSKNKLVRMGLRGCRAFFKVPLERRGVLVGCQNLTLANYWLYQKLLSPSLNSRHTLPFFEPFITAMKFHGHQL